MDGLVEYDEMSVGVGGHAFPGNGESLDHLRALRDASSVSAMTEMWISTLWNWGSGSRGDECDGGDSCDGDANGDGTNKLSFSGLYREND